MDIQTTVVKLVKALEHQQFSFNETLFKQTFKVDDYNYYSGTKKTIIKALSAFGDRFVSYSDVDSKKFNSYMTEFQKEVSEEMLISWKFSSGYFILTGAIYSDTMSDEDMRSLFARFDSGIVSKMRKNAGRLYGGAKAATYGTLIPIFMDENKVQKFNSVINDFYHNHFIKSTIVSCASIDCTNETLTQGKGPLGMKWQGGFDFKLLKKDLFH